MSTRVIILTMICAINAFTIVAAKPKVVATASIFMDMAKQIGGDKIEVFTVVPIGADPHIYEPTPADAALVANADLILKNGLTFEGWLNELIENAGSKAKITLITDGIPPITSVEFHNATDPHAWMSAYNGLMYIYNIKKAICEIDPKNKDFYEKNYETYRERIMALDNEIKEKINTLPMNQRILITSHDAFHYYAQRYNLTVEAVLGTSTDAEVQTADLIRLNDLIRKNKIPAVFIETTLNPKLLSQIAEDNHCIIGGSLYADSIGEADSPAPTYEAMLRHNTNQIVDALMGKAKTAIVYERLPKQAFLGIGITFLCLWLLVFFKIKRFENNAK
jgi:ABC-type Zn uptake system ZnuABC Zn-binding protein ZnuA